MKKIFCLLAAIACCLGLSAQVCDTFAFRSYNMMDSVSAKGWGADTFQLSMAYPAKMPDKPKGGFPWERIEPSAKPSEYMNAVLSYCWEGMDSAKFVAQYNPVRVWYHAPWLDHGYAGREYLRGLTMDRTSLTDELASKQKSRYRNYSIVYYNPQAAYTLGQVWCDKNKPDPTKAKFPVGSVWFRLVFTMADTAEVPSLLNAMEWEAYIETGTELPLAKKTIKNLRLIEVDFGVRSESKDAVNGWVFGVYVFDGRKQGKTVTDNLVPVGLQWGNDPGVTPAQVRNNEKKITQTWINPKAYDQDNPAVTLVQKIGWGFRLQGPVANRGGSVMSEHMTAGWPPAPAVPPLGTPGDSILNWHRNLPPGTPFNEGQVSLDYCLELMKGIRNHAIAGGDSALAAAYEREWSDLLGFDIAKRDEKPAEEVEEVIEYDEGLTGRNLFVFIAFIVLILVMVGLLIRNFKK